MSKEAELAYGRCLQILVTHLIKNASKVPKPVFQGALDFENHSWRDLPAETKRSRLQEIAELTAAPSAIHRHMEAYPHQFSKQRYAEYLDSLRAYQATLGG